MGYQKFPECAVRVLADTELAIPALTGLCRERVAKDARAKKRIDERKKVVADIHNKARAEWREEAREDWDSSPISLPRLAMEVWEQIQSEDWVLTTQTFENWALKLWNIDKPHRWPGKPLGTGTQIGMAIGVALAHRDKGRLVIDCQTDGDLMFDAGALWFAAKHKVPMLCIMHNNRAYYNDWEHQITVARQRGTPEERAYIGMDIDGPPPDFATLARSMGWYAEGPIDKPADIAPALKRAIAEVKRGKPALIDTITQHSG
jgi:acetolactate synthase-1/2/3 large subunit